MYLYANVYLWSNEIRPFILLNHFIYSVTHLFPHSSSLSYPGRDITFDIVSSGNTSTCSYQSQTNAHLHHPVFVCMHHSDPQDLPPLPRSFFQPWSLPPSFTYFTYFTSLPAGSSISCLFVNFRISVCKWLLVQVLPNLCTKLVADSRCVLKSSCVQFLDIYPHVFMYPIICCLWTFTFKSVCYLLFFFFPHPWQLHYLFIYLL